MKLQDSICGGLEGKVILAKSNPLVTLDEHIEDCMLVMQLLKKSLPYIGNITNYKKRIWRNLFIAIFFHDVGKATEGFQKMLITGKRYKFRHERLSGAFFDKVFIGDMTQEEKTGILRAILTHHKVCEELKDILNSESYREDLSFIFESEDVVGFNTEWEKMQFDKLDKFLKKIEEFAAQYGEGLLGSYNYKFCLQNLDKPNDVLGDEINKICSLEKLSKEYFSELIFWGLLKNCDHMGSAKIKKIPLIQPQNQNFLKNLIKAYNHQKECWRHKGNVLLIAPTGSGKTEAAFGWAFNIINNFGHRHIFYILPYTASINAMFYRLNKDIDGGKDPFSDETVVGLVHGKLRQFVADFFDEDYYDEKRVKELAENYRMIVKPIKVTTPFQILKYLFGVKGFEKGLIELAGAILIYDEIHAYDKETFLRILWSLDWFQKYMKVKVFVTTATLPTFLQDLLMQTLGLKSSIRADEDLLKSFTRHKVKIVDGTIEENIEQIIEEINNRKKVLVVCNTVDKAQAIYKELKNYLTDNEISLLHSRFVYKDRIAQEKSITKEDSSIKVLIGTQAIEVSLNIDYDVLFSEPAPLDALLQRFGRINRKRAKGICQVNIFSEGGRYDHKVYDVDTVKATLDELKNVETTLDGIIYEDRLQEMMDRVYKAWDLKSYEIQMLKKDFYSMMEKLLPYREHKITEEEFEDQFQTIEVLPRYYYEQYIKLMDEGKLLQAEMLTCQLHKSKLYNPKVRENFTRLDKGLRRIKDVWLIDCKYDEKMGLILSEKEMINSFL